MMGTINHFYDIESLSNVFTLCDYHDDHVDIYFINDDVPIGNNFEDGVITIVHEKNANFKGGITLYDLSDSKNMDHLATIFGCSDSYDVCNPSLFPSRDSKYDRKYRIVCDTDPEYDPDKYPYFFGYNSDNYDLTMLATLFFEALPHKGDSKVFSPVSASFMRKVNDQLFAPAFKDNMPKYLRYMIDEDAKPKYKEDRYTVRNKIYTNMLRTGRHLDVAKLNEKQQKVKLKRLLGVIGCQILESDKLKPGQDTIENEEQFLELIAYNVSDCVNLEVLFNDEVYQGAFILKRGLLQTYPELIYRKQENKYAPDIRPEMVRNDRLLITSSSAKLATMALCPYGELDDLDCVSYMYPSEEKAKEKGIQRVNVLEQFKTWFYDHFDQPEIRAKFDNIYTYYKSLEGKNFNESKSYAKKHDLEQYPVCSLKDIPATEMSMPYFYADGTPSSCYAALSIGGVHGAEYNKELYDNDLEEFKKKQALFNEVMTKYQNPTDLRIAKTVTLSDGEAHSYTEFLKSGGSIKKANFQYKTIDEPKLFKWNEKKQASELNKKYVYTSVADTNHEDFKSYYPNMLIMMSAFKNTGLGYDRYEEIFGNKEKYGKLKKEAKTDEEKQKWDIQRNGTKLILNSASGAADANFESPIRMNNRIISMRIIGQCFTTMIGCAQTYEGASVPSTNTDGLYTVMEETLNNKILARESANIGVEIEPEPLHLISKDTNNRIEMVNGKIASASGGSLGGWNGPTTAKSATQPAAIDRTLACYLTQCKDLSAPFDKEAGLKLLNRVFSEAFIGKLAKNRGISLTGMALLMFQHIAVSNQASNTFIYSFDDDGKTNVLQNCNRIFFVKSGTPGAVHLKAATYRVVTDAMLKQRKKAEEPLEQDDPLAVELLKGNGVTSRPKTKGKFYDATCQKIPRINPEWYVLIDNSNLYLMRKERQKAIVDALDFNAYLALLENAYENSWRNAGEDEEKSDQLSLDI